MHSSDTLSFTSFSAFKETAKAELKKRRTTGLEATLASVQKELAARTRFKTFHALRKHFIDMTQEAAKNAVLRRGGVITGSDGLNTLAMWSEETLAPVISRLIAAGEKTYRAETLPFQPADFREVIGCHLKDLELKEAYDENDEWGDGKLLQRVGMAGLRFVNCRFERVSFYGDHEWTSFIGCTFVDCLFRGMLWTSDGKGLDNHRGDIGTYGEVSGNAFAKCRFLNVGALPVSRKGCHGNRLMEPLFSTIDYPQFRRWAEDAWKYLNGSPFALEKGEQITNSRVSNYLPKASLSKALQYLAEKSLVRAGVQRGVFVEGRHEFWLVEDTCDGQTVVAWLDEKQYQQLLSLGAIKRDSYGGFKGRHIHDQDMARARQAVADGNDEPTKVRAALAKRKKQALKKYKSSDSQYIRSLQATVFVYKLSEHPTDPIVGEDVEIDGEVCRVKSFTKQGSTITPIPGAATTMGWISVEGDLRK